MGRDYRLLFGPLAASILAVAIVVLAEMVPNYSHVQQTVSEIGEVGSPARVLFAAALCLVAICLVFFALALRDFLRRSARSPWAAYLVAAMAVSAAGVGVFAHPHPLHNVFGLSELVGYQAPLAFALAWRRSQARSLLLTSWVAWGLTCAAIVLNLSFLDRSGSLWAYVAPNYGLAQRALFASWFGWCAVIGILLFRRESRVDSGASSDRLHVADGATHRR
jgi:hypothetical membrane protein